MEYTCQVSSTSAQRSGSLRVLKMLTPHGRTDGRTFVRFLPRDAMHKRGLCRHAVSVCLSVCARLSVTFVSCVKMNKHIIKHFSPSGSHTILVFPYQTGWQYSDGNPPNGGVECRFWTNNNGFAAYRSTVLSTVRVAKCEKTKPRRTAASVVQLSAATVVRCSHKRTTKCL